MGKTVITAVAALSVVAAAQQNPNAPANFVKVNAPVVILTNARVIDGSGAPARENQNIVIRGDTIAEVADVVRIDRPPRDTAILDLAGKTVMPGLVMMHEYLFYPTGP